MAYADRQQGSSRIIAIVIVALVHLVIGYVFVTGLAYKIAKKTAEDLNVFDVEEEPPPPEEEPPPPPPDRPVEPPPVVAPPPLVRTNAPPPPINTVTTPPPFTPPTTLPPRTAAPPAPPPPPPPPPRPSQAAKARANLSSYFSTDDYPSSALRAEEEGVVSVSLTIGPDGRVSGCTVTASSGSSALDNATCNIIRRKARYTPAKDDAGNNIGGTDRGRVRWQIPEDR